MAAYLIYNLVDVYDQQALGEYQSAYEPTLEKYGGRRVASDPAFDILEGEWDGKRQVIIEFPDIEALHAWYNSDDYQPLIPIRQKAAHGHMIAVSGARRPR